MGPGLQYCNSEPMILRRQLGVTNAARSKLIGVDSSVESRRLDSARKRMKASGELRKLVKQIEEAALKTG